VTHFTPNRKKKNYVLLFRCNGGIGDKKWICWKARSERHLLRQKKKKFHSGLNLEVNRKQENILISQSFERKFFVVSQLGEF
jgi:hypothetical protein